MIFYRAHYDLEADDISLYELHKAQLLLDKTIFSIAALDQEPSGLEAEKHVDTLKGIRAAMAELVEAAEKTVPFHGTPEPEREILEDILELTEADREIVYQKLGRLGELVAARQETILTLGEEKGNARRLALWGLCGTILFGTASIALTLTWAL